VARLYLRCAICDRQQADGLISGAAWGRFEAPPTASASHPALSGPLVRACPTCVQRHPDWQARIARALGLDTDDRHVTDAA
jgi:hypothetical protein